MGEFQRRHIGPSDSDLTAMLDEVGYSSLDDLIRAAVPDSIRIDEPLDLPASRNRGRGARATAPPG